MEPIYDEVIKLLEKQKKTYEQSHEVALAFSNNERQIVGGYQGRQLLEMLQNADDSGAEEVAISFKNNKLTVSDTGCGFSLEGIQSLFIPNCSSKTNSTESIGNKGIGFRSILSWGENIALRTRDCELLFSKETAAGYAKTLYGEEKYNNYRTRRGLSTDEVPFPILGICSGLDRKKELKKGTDITIDCFENKKAEIEEQLNIIEKHFLMFTKHLEKITINNKPFSREMGETIKSGGVEVTPITIIGDNKTEKWRVFEKQGVYDESVDIRISDRKYIIKIALPSGTYEYRRVMYNYFPMQEYLGLPCIIHCTSDTDSNRNYLNSNPQNHYLLSRTAEFLIDIADILKQENSPANWAPASLLTADPAGNESSSSGSKIKMVLLDELKEHLNNLDIFPTNSGEYKKKNACYYYSDEINSFFKKYSRNIPDLLLCDGKPAGLRPEYKPYEDCRFVDMINSISGCINEIEARGALIKTVTGIYANASNENVRFSLLTNENGEIIPSGKVGYIGREKDVKYSIPSNLNVDFVNAELYTWLEKNIEYTLESDSDTRPRALARILRHAINVRSYDLDNLLEQIESFSKTFDEISLIKRTVTNLYDIFLSTKFKKELKIKLVNRRGNVCTSDDLFFGEEYYSDSKTENIYEGIYDDENYLASPDFWDLPKNSPNELQDFFSQLGVSMYYKLSVQKKYKDKEYFLHLNKYYNEAVEYWDSRLCAKEYVSMKNIEAIQRMSFGQLIRLFSHFDRRDIREQWSPDTSVHVYKDIYRNKCDLHIPLTGLRYQLQKIWNDEKKDFCIVKCIDGVAILGKDIDTKLSFIGDDKKGMVMEILRSTAYDFTKHSLDENTNLLNRLEKLDPGGTQVQRIYRSAYRALKDTENCKDGM